MQLIKSNYNSKEHTKFKALNVKQPYAQYISDGKKSIEVRSRNTTYRGDFIVCSNLIPEVEGCLSGAVLCIASLWDVVKFKDLSDTEKAQSQIPENEWKRYNDFYAWKIQNVRKVIEKPVIGNQGFWTLYCTYDYIIEYPLELGGRKLTEQELKREFVKEHQDILRKSRHGLFFILGAVLIVISLLIFLYKIIF